MFSWAVIATILGVIASHACTLSSFMMFWMTLFSSESITPSSTPMLAIAVTSSLLTEASSSSFSMERLISPTRSTNGYIRNIRTDMQRVEKPMRFFQEEVPIVLGTISANSSINRVKIPEMIPNQVLPNSSVACRPTPAAPIVLAMVFRERIAASGFSVSVLYSRNLVAGLYPCSFFIVMKESGVDNSTDSSMEQRNETSSVPMRNIKRSPINDPNNMQI